MRRRAVVFLAVIGMAGVVTSESAGKRWPTLEFRPSAAEPGEVVIARVDLTPAHYVAPPKPGPRIEIFLVPARIARTVNSPEDHGVRRAVVIRADVNWRGVASFRVPDLPAGRYAGAYRIGETFHPPRSARPLDLHAFELRIRPGASSAADTLGIAAGVAGAALAAAALARRRLGGAPPK